MPANTSPIFTLTPNVGAASVVAANTRSDGNGTIGTDIYKVFTAGSNGAFFNTVRFALTASSAATAAAATTPKAAVNDGEPAAANAPTNGQAFAASPAKLSDKQDKMIFALFCKLESDETKRAERMAKALEAYKVKDKKDLTMTQAKHLIDKLLKMTGSDEAPAAQ